MCFTARHWLHQTGSGPRGAHSLIGVRIENLDSLTPGSQLTEGPVGARRLGKHLEGLLPSYVPPEQTHVPLSRGHPSHVYIWGFLNPNGAVMRRQITTQNAIRTHKRDLQVAEKFTEARDQIPLKTSSKTTWRRAHLKLKDGYGVLGEDRERQGTGEGKCVFSVESSVAGTRAFVGEEPVVQELGCQGSTFRALGLSFPT